MTMSLFKQKQQYDETAQEAAETLLEQLWVIREKEPEIYQMIRERENELRNYFFDKLGYRLFVHRHFAKLEKIPAEPEPWMGIQSFQHPRDYTLLSLLLAFLEGKTVDEQFLLSELIEEMKGLNPIQGELDWNHYEHRKSLVRVLQFAQEHGILETIDGDIEAFHFIENNEVLFEVPIISRYFMRSYPKDLFQFNSIEELLEAEWIGEDENAGLKRRHRIYRKLLLSPVTYSIGPNDPDFLYLRNYRNRIREDIEKHTSFQFELYKNAAMLTLPEKKAAFTLFPDNRAIVDITLQFAHIVRNLKEEEDIPLQYDGNILLTLTDFEHWVRLTQDQFGAGWSKYYREATMKQITKDLLEILEEWKMAAKDEETGTIRLLPLLARVAGQYPRDFIQHNGEEGDANEQE